MTPDVIPDYPFWQASEVEAVFGAERERYVNRYDAGDISRLLRKEVKAGSALFFSGGRLADHGLQWRPEIAAQKPMLTLQALLCSYAPAHEAKEATVALALHHWCEPTAEAEA